VGRIGGKNFIIQGLMSTPLTTFFMWFTVLLAYPSSIFLRRKFFTLPLVMESILRSPNTGFAWIRRRSL
jgi:hypothetical protein